MNRTDKLLTLLIELVIDTHNYVDLEKHKKRLRQIESSC